MATTRALSSIQVVDLAPAQNLAFERARRAAEAQGSQRVEIQLVDTSERATLEAWGQSDALFIDGRQVRTGPPPSQEKLARLIARRVTRLERRAPDRAPDPGPPAGEGLGGPTRPPAA